MRQIVFNKEYWIVSVVFVLALVLRLPTLASPLIEDEAISFNRYFDKPLGSLIYNYYDTNQYTLLILLSKFSIWVLGVSEIAYRLPSFLAGIFSVPLTYMLGRVIKVPWPSAVISALLMGISWPHLKYSLEGRGYSLTIFLVLLATYSAFRLLSAPRLRWGSVFIVAGFAMTMALPSNLFFLSGLAIFTVLIKYLESKENIFSVKSIIWTGVPALITFVLVGVYFLVIYEGLKYGKSVHPLPIDGERIRRIMHFLVAPWGPWMYLFFAFGFWRLREKRKKALFTIIFTVPKLMF